MDRRRVLQASAVGALTLATGGVLAACGSSSGSSTGASGGSGEDVSFGFSHPYSDVPLVALVKELVQKDAEKLGWSVSLDASKGGSLAEQTKTLETWVTQKLTAICAFPPDPTALEALARRATDEGTIWTTYGEKEETAAGGVLFPPTLSGEVTGKGAVAWIKKNNPTAQVMILSYPPSTWSKPRWEIPEEMVESEKLGRWTEDDPGSFSERIVNEGKGLRGSDKGSELAGVVVTVGKGIEDIGPELG